MLTFLIRGMGAGGQGLRMLINEKMHLRTQMVSDMITCCLPCSPGRVIPAGGKGHAKAEQD